MIKNKIMNLKAEEIGERTVRFKISSEVVDRDGDILIATGCDFNNFMKNPVFLPFHKSDAFPLGKVVNIFIDGNAVFADVYFPKVEELAEDKQNASEKAKLVDFTYHCYKNGMLNAVSVGFIAKEVENILDSEGFISGFKVLQWELLEFSAVSIPANQEAIAQAVKSFGADKAKLFLQIAKKDLTADEEPIPDGNDPVETENVRALIKACNDRVKACENGIKEVAESLKECMDGIKEIIKELKEEVIEVVEGDDDNIDDGVIDIQS